MAEIWGAVVIGGATLAKGYMDAKAAKRAGNASAAGADRAADVQWDIFNQSRADNEPWRQAGLTAQSQILSLLGLPQQNVAQAISQSAVSTKPQTWFGDNGGRDEMAYYNDPNYRAAWDEVARFHNYDPNNAFTRRGEDRGKIAAHMQQVYNQRIQGAQKPAAAGGAAAKPLTQQQAFDAFRATPGYQFGLTEGVRALDSSAAASGGLFSGKAAKALTKFGTDYADQQGYRPYMSNLFQLAGYGQTATAQNQQAGQQAASNVGNALMSAGNARASGIQGSANAWGNTLNGLAGAAGYAYGNRGSWGWGGV